MILRVCFGQFWLSTRFLEAGFCTLTNTSKIDSRETKQPKENSFGGIHTFI